MNQHSYISPLPETTFSFSILITSPIRRDVKFSPTSALILPLAAIEINFATLIVAFLDLFLTFLYKRSLIHAPQTSHGTSDSLPTLTLTQLNQLMYSARQGQLPMQRPVSTAPDSNRSFGSVGPDEPFFPDSLSISLMATSSLAPFDGSPDTSFSVPLLEFPGAPGNLLIALGLIISQFFLERGETPTDAKNGGNVYVSVDAILQGRTFCQSVPHFQPAPSRSSRKARS